MSRGLVAVYTSSITCSDSASEHFLEYSSPAHVRSFERQLALMQIFCTHRPRIAPKANKDSDGELVVGITPEAIMRESPYT
jgi:hypothetical protein